jgi:hypothetical protein
MHAPFRCVVTSALVLGCSTVVVQEGPEDGGGGSSVASSGAADTVSVTQTTSVGAGGTGGSASFCGGKSGFECAPEELCDYPDDSCGFDDGTGVCVERPVDCPADCPGVCGCDQKFYCNECTAQGSGVDVTSDTGCLEPQPSEYSATFWSGGLDHLIIKKWDARRQVCLRLFLDAPGGTSPGWNVEAPSEFVATRADISQDAEMCLSPEGGSGSFVEATGASGIVFWTGTTPCVVDVDVSVEFVTTSSWVLPIETMLTDQPILVGGGCP